MSRIHPFPALFPIESCYRLLLAAAFILAGCGGEKRAEGDLGKLPIVHTWGDLLQAPPVVDAPFESWIAKNQDLRFTGAPQAKDKVTIRMGINPGSGRVQGGTLVYCLVETTKRFEIHRNGVYSNSFIGPFTFTVAKVDAPTLQAANQVCGSSARIEFVRSLFMAVVPHTEAGTFRLDILDRTDIQLSAAITRKEEKKIAHAEWAISGNETEAPWLPFSPAEGMGAEATTKVTLPDALPGALPWVDGSKAYPLPEVLNPRTPLPDLLPQNPSPSLKAIAGTDLLTLTLDKEYGMSAGQEQAQVLTRWWVNGKAWNPSDHRLCLTRERAGQTAPQDRFDFRILLDPKTSGFQEGDAVSLQTLFCPEGWEYLSGLQQAREPTARLESTPPSLPAVAQLSPRVEYVYRKGHLEPKSP